ncbi:protein Smaug 1-like protein [Dinothrombium tinctorium]|uniref:Protein Smaug 1-like protein n=1 Tax=Dinothrombium tinctorium TaxID=1965070 RepID=A0A443QP99_9ACAR|nr:protein Smaug 1-like protein [Dinothrombium tinctorium]
MATICAYFDEMNICEQTVALCSLLKRVNRLQSKFIITMLDYPNELQTQAAKDLTRLERDANDCESIEQIISHLLSYLPLFKPGNDKLKQQYFTLITRVVSHSLTTSSHIDDARQILCYSLIHPALSQEEKKALTFWAHRFEITFLNSGSEKSCNEVQSKPEANFTNSGMKDVPVWLKSLRLHKYAPHFAKMTYETMMSLAEEDLEKMNITKGARHKIVLNIQKLRQRQENLRVLEKSLAEEGVSVLGEVLKELKYVLSTPIKAYSRSQMDGDSKDESKADLMFTQKPNRVSPPCADPSCDFDCDTNQCVPDGDLPGQIAKIMGKVCSTILMSSHIDEENVNSFISIITSCLNQDYFTKTHVRKFVSWKMQLDKLRKNHCRQLRGHNNVNYLKTQHINIYRTQSAPVRQVLSSGHFETGPESDHLNNQTESLCLRVTEHALGPLG